jgi:hypothetical protein
MPRKKSKNNVPGNQNASARLTSSSAPVLTQETTKPAEQSDPVAQPAGNTPARQNSELQAGWIGSWRGKARPVAEIARESATSTNGTPRSGANPAPLSHRSSIQDLNSPSPKRYLSGSLNPSTKGTPLAATTTNLSIASSNNSKVKPLTESAPTGDKGSTGPEVADPPLPPEPPAPAINPSVERPSTPQRPATPTGWFGGWWSRPDGYGDGKKPEAPKAEDSLLEEAKSKHLPATTPGESPENSKVLRTMPIDIDSGNKVDTNDNAMGDNALSKSADTRSWFFSWTKAQDPRPSTAQSHTEVAPPQNGNATSDATVPENKHLKIVTAEELGSKDGKAASMKDGQEGKTAKRASGWAFWSKQVDEPETGENGNIHKHIGEIAVANTPSQSNPEAAQFNELEQPLKGPISKSTPKRGRGRPSSKVDESSVTKTPPDPKAEADKEPPKKETQSLSKQVAAKFEPPKQKHLLLPEFNKTYSILQRPSIWQNLKEYFIGGETHHAQLHLLTNPLRIRKALAVGIHGFFPPGLLQKVIGAPTGTSIRFSDSAAAAIKSWTEKHGYECEIEKVALEGEGLIAERVDTLWKLLLNWIEHVRSADLIMFACHSQGVPVTIMLVERLIKFKCIRPTTRIGICAMAGINLGPFAEYKTKWLGTSAFELFEFSNPSSRVSKDYRASLEEVLKHGVKIVYIGSIDDQLVSLEVHTYPYSS